MANVILPFLMSMILGRTIDLTSYDIGGSVFDDAEYDETPIRSLNTTYHVIQDDVFPYKFFGLPTDIILRIKSNILSSSSGSMGLDGLLKDTSWKYNSAVIAVTTVYRTVDRSLKADAKPLDNWQDTVKKSQTHYAESLLYGGWSVVLFRYRCDIPGDVQTLRHTLTNALGANGELNQETIDLWNKVKDSITKNRDIRGQVKMTTQVYSTATLEKEVTTPESLLKVLEDFQNTVGSLGQPLYMKLHPLYDLDKEFREVKENVEIVGDLAKLDEMMDDVKETKVSLMRWITETLTTFADQDEERIYKLLNKINNCIRAFNKVSGEASLYTDTDRDLLDYAFHQYLSGLEKGIGKYNLAYMKLKEEIDAECEDNFLHKIRGLLKVYDNEQVKKGKVKGGFKECQELCVADNKCRAVGYADQISQLDMGTGQYYRLEKQCWIYFRSTSTAAIHTPSGLSGEMGVYDRNCYVK